MFGKQKTNNLSSGGVVVASDGTVKADHFSVNVENIAVRTMKKDLEDLKKGVDAEVDFSIPPSPPRSSSPVRLSEKQKTSPFLSQEERGASDELPKPDIDLSDKELGFSEPSRGINWGRFLMIAIVFLIIAILGLGGYFFWVTRMGGEFPSDVSISGVFQFGKERESAISVDQSVALPEEPAFSLISANPATFDLATLNRETFQEFFLDKGKILSRESITSPVEFSLRDIQNNPISFQDFSQKIGLSFKSPLLSNLNSAFSVYLYNDRGSQRLGLVVDSRDENALKSLMISEEADLPQEVESLFLISQYEIEKKPFNSSMYQDVSVRFFNVTSPEDLTVDYAIYSSKLFIGTTKMTLRSILDKYLGVSGIK